MRLNIMAKLFLFILVPALLGLCLVAVLDYRGAERAVVNLIQEESSLTLDRTKSELTSVVGLLQDVIHNSGDAVHIQALLNASSTATKEQLEELRTAASGQAGTIAKNFPLLSAVGILNTEGTLIAHSDPKAVNLKRGERADREYFKEAMKGKTTLQNLVSRTDKSLSTVLAGPVKKGDKIIGVIFANMDIDTLGKQITDTIKLGSTGICYIYDGKGIMRMHPNKSYLGDDDSNTPWVKAMQTQKNGSVEYEWNGKTKVAFFRYLPEVDWFVVLSMEKEDMLSSVTAIARNSLLVGGTAVVLVSLIILLVARSVSHSLRACSQVVGRVSEGELTLSDQARLDLEKAQTRSDEIGSLARGIGRMTDNIRKLLAESTEKTEAAQKATEEARLATQEAEAARRAAENAKREGMLAAAERLEGIVNIVSSASEQLSAQIEQSERGAAEQAARVAETATAMEEMNSTVLEVARNAGTAADVSTRTREMAATGSSVVNTAAQSIQTLQQQSLGLKDDMGTLDEHARAISQIMSVISDIADQTNLLALNAAIEAARAGEAGRGFAVVADEVRKLAEKTMASTTDVGNAIKSIQSSAQKSARQVDETVETINAVAESSGQSGAALEEIVTMADSAVDQVRAIATASEEQSATSEEINRSIAQVSGIANETSRAMQEAASAVSELARQAQALSRLIEEMKQS